MKYKISAFVFLAFILLMACESNDLSNSSLDLTQMEWEFRQVGTDKWYQASVPGNVISDLVMHEVLPDPFFRYNEDSAQWVENHDWEFTTQFNVKSAQANALNQRIVFEGLDTYADVYLNDSLIISANNMFHAWESDVNNLLKQGKNTLRLYFHSPVKIQNERYDSLGYIAINTNEFAPETEKKRTFSRKAPFHFGWDWGPRLVTSGIWRPAKIIFSNVAEIREPYFRPLFVSADSAVYQVEAQLQHYSAEDTEATVSVLIDGKEYVTENISLSEASQPVILKLKVDNPELWWCHGYGEPHLYEASIRLKVDGVTVDTYKAQLGIRDIQLVQEPDSIGRSFYFQLNGIPVFAKGANYIPSHTLTTEVTDSVYQSVIEDALQANMNMLRVWGGAIYENDRFYKLCDENGILVWQDFMFACELTPPVDYMYESIRKEAEYNVKRLRNHPSIALWCGNNENLTAWETWGWKSRYSEETVEALDQGFNKIYYEILPEAVASYQPEITYWPSSPAAYPGDVVADRKSGDEHDWTIWFGQKPFENYGEEVPRFASEYGIQAYPEMKTIESFTVAGDREYKSELLDYRQRSKMDWITPGFNGNDMIKQYTEMYFHEPADFASHVYLSQLMQARALKTGIEAHRSSPRCMGSLYWQLNDCWPTVSWATVDYFGRWKAAHYAVKKAFEKVLAVPVLNENDLQVSLVSEWMTDVPVDVEVFGFNLNETQQPTKIAEKNVSLSSLSITPISFEISGDFEGYYVEVIREDNSKLMASNSVFETYPKEQQYNQPAIQSSRKAEDGKIFLTLTTDVFARGVRLTANADGNFSDNYFDMLPGKTYEIEFVPYQAEKVDEVQFEIASYADFILNI